MPTPDQAAALAATLHTCNLLANRISESAFSSERRSRASLQADTYQDLKGAGLSAQPALHVIRKVADAYTALAAKSVAKPISFRSAAAQPFDDRCLSWKHDQQTVSIWTVVGRLKNVCFSGHPDQLKTLREHRRGETDLVQRDGTFYLVATCELPAAEPNANPAGWIGVDLGIENVATLSTSADPKASVELNRYRRRMLAVRAELQAKGTKSAKRKFKRRSRREARHAADVNHRISKEIVAEAQRTGSGIGLEDLTGIRDRVRLRKPQRATLHSWAFAQLGSFVAYKAERAGVPVVYVDPAYTSQACSWCGHVEKRNRPSQAKFACRSCGVVAHADWNAARNIGFRAERLWAAVNQPHAAVPSQPVAPPGCEPGSSRAPRLT